MPEPKRAPYGSWKSPITSNLITSETTRLGQVKIDGDDVYWIEMRPREGGRNVIVRRSACGDVSDITPSPYNVRTRVHEYGGGAYAVEDGTVYFSNFKDQRLYGQPPGEEPAPVTAGTNMRYADYVLDRRRGSLIAVREDHSREGREAVNALVAIELNGGGRQKVIVSGNDFYSSPRISPDGSRLAWLAWDHPNMPWDGTELWVGRIETDGSIGKSTRVAGGPEESVFQPEWSPDGDLYFVSDRTGWWNLYRLGEGKAEPVLPLEAEFGSPQWVFGMSLYAFESADRIVAAFCRKGRWGLMEIDITTGKYKESDLPYTDIGYLKADDGRAVFIGSSTTELPSIVHIELASAEIEIMRRSADIDIDRKYYSVPRAIEFPTGDGLPAHGFYYPPQNPYFIGPENEKPPLIVISHGGPTGSTTAALDLHIQYWTGRGFGVLDVNYGGSSGYGREYMRRLDGRWGIVDVDDCINGARYLVERGEVDGYRLAIRGGSAGGYTTLRSLTSSDFFQAGASYFGVSDLEALTKETHKFESRYLDRLIGPYPQAIDIYRQRSPIYHIEELSCPLILFQGLEDEIVPPNQAEMIVDTLRTKKLPVAYIAFEGEQHGFRIAENIKRSLDAELYFYSRVFGFTPADKIEPVEIENL